MALVPLPQLGDTSWYDWAADIHLFAARLHGTSVKDFGAVGDGVNDDYLAIQAAIDAAEETGGAIYFPAGDYAISQTIKVNKDGMYLHGDGAGARTGASQSSIGSRIKAMAGLTGALILVQRPQDDRPLQGVHIRNLSVDGGSLGTLVDGIIFRVNQGSIDNVHIWKCTGNGLLIRGYAVPYWDTYDTRFANLVIGYCGGGGVVLSNNAADLHFSHSIFLENNDNLISRGSSGQFTGCHFYTAVRYNLWFDGAGSRHKFANCKVEGSSNHLVFIDTTNGGYSDIQFTGCGFSSLNQSTVHNSYDYVNIAGPSGIGAGRCTFIGNSFNNKGGSAVKARYAINLASSAAQNTVIVANSFGVASHWGTSPLNNASNSSLLPYIRDNFGLPDLILPEIKTTAYTLTPDDALGNIVEINSATAVTVTVPPNAQPGFMKGNVVKICQVGAGVITLTPGAGVTLRSRRTLITTGQWACVTLRQRASNEWVVEGDV